MGMTIEDIEQWARQNNYTIVADNWWEAAQDRINKYQQLQADYENRLKADMADMLEVIKLRIDNLPEPLNRDRVNYCIQQKINELKGDQEGKE